MNHWMLLLITLAASALTFDTFRWGAPVRETRMASQWEPNLEVEPAQPRSHSPRALFGFRALPWLFLAMTLLLAAMTVQAFIG